ncbi:MAG: manganese efflux pump MntP family protein [Clostridia bacterium]|nr:manganese efflux pump MntP family protein [Clostridia bacterium]
MWFLVLQVVLFGVSLALDAFAVSITDGMCYNKLSKGKGVTIPLTFGIFQALMPLAGYFLVVLFANSISTFDEFDHYVAFAILLIIGGKMVLDGIKELRSTEETVKVKKFFYPEVLLQGVATSIDALAVGVTMGAMDGVNNVNIFWLVAIIGVITFAISLVGLIVGVKIGKLFKNKTGIAEIIGGLVLVAIGLKILIEGIIAV